MGPRVMRMGIGEGSTMSNFIVCTVQSRRLGWAGHVVRMEEYRSAFKILRGKPTGKRPLRPRRTLEDNIRMELEEIGMNAGNWVDSAQDRDYWSALVNGELLCKFSSSAPYQGCMYL